MDRSRLRPSPRLGVSLVFAINGFLGANWVARIPAVVQKLETSMDTLGTLLLLFAPAFVTNSFNVVYIGLTPDR